MFLDHKHCTNCKRDNQPFSCSAGTAGHSVCDECYNKESEDKRKEHFAKLDALPLHARIRKIEEWVYEHDKISHINYGAPIG